MRQAILLQRRRGIFAISALLILMGVFIIPRPPVASAHPLGNFTINRYSRIEPHADRIYLRYVLDMAEIPTFQEMPKIDLDRDGQVSDEERAAYLPSRVEELKNGLHLSVNDSPVQALVVEQELTFPPGQGDLPTLRLSFLLQGQMRQTNHQKEQNLYYRDDNYSQRLGWREIVVRPGNGVFLTQSTVSELDQTDELRVYPRDMLKSPLNLREARSTFVIEGGVSQATEFKPASTTTVVETGARSDDLLTSLITADRLSFSVVVLSFILALGLGAVHAISPGHGKTIMAAYLVGTRGTAKHALFLGFTVTVSHTLGVLGLGLVVLFASSLVSAERLYPWLGLISGVIIIVVGLWLLIARLRSNREVSHHHSHVAAASQSHSHPQVHPAASKPVRFHRRLRETVVKLLHGHSHDADHQPHDTGNLRITWKSLTALGVVGGLVPSVAALVILLAAISLHRIGFGLALILAFSVGMATVLAGLGLILVYARRLVEKFQFQNRLIGSFTRILPLATALVVLLSGLVVTIRAGFQIGLL